MVHQATNICSSLPKVFFRELTKEPWRIVASVAACALLAFYALRKIPSLQRRISTMGSNLPHATPLQKQLFRVRNWIYGPSSIELYGKLADLAKTAKPPSQESFLLGGVWYIAYSPSDKSLMPAGILNSINDSHATMIMSLVEKNQPFSAFLRDKNNREGWNANHLDSQLSMTAYNGEWGQYQIGKKPFYYIHEWENGYVIPHGMLPFIASIAKVISNEQIVYIHEDKGQCNTAVFLAMIEMIRRKEIRNNSSNAELKTAMIGILSEIAKSSRHCVPNSQQISMLLMPDFLRSLVVECRLPKS